MISKRNELNYLLRPGLVATHTVRKTRNPASNFWILAEVWMVENSHTSWDEVSFLLTDFILDNLLSLLIGQALMILENSYDISVVGIRKLLLCVGKIIICETNLI